ncbi:hypothetical protein TNCV_987611 [Trichonephila clavipes]|nr:hypothetical protein TNCV_987611 [Trichonephila clavipes]
MKTEERGLKLCLFRWWVFKREDGFAQDVVGVEIFIRRNVLMELFIWGIGMDQRKVELGEEDQISSYINNIKNLTLLTSSIYNIKWAGHVVRMNEDRTTINIVIAQLIGKRRKGRPNLRWTDDLEKRSPSFEN